MRASLSCGALVVLMVVVMGVFEIPMVKGAISPSQCEQEKRLLVNACRAVVLGQNPSANCCQRVRVTHFECVCPYVTPKLAALLGVQRTIKQVQGCGRTVPRNFKCGSITTPP
ncbi:hypothetical protein Pint_01332 [Pistacia integerrima]|uniref:Uncharacterized protein n=1 Tax=Pistacia integerrima TaxID=434235 RepID=A0ACC0ZR72_9ROSI|nr:hypothetical protein Pint_01332 [Pistacia integerrima]